VRVISTDIDVAYNVEEVEDSDSTQCGEQQLHLAGFAPCPSQAYFWARTLGLTTRSRESNDSVAWLRTGGLPFREGESEVKDEFF